MKKVVVELLLAVFLAVGVGAAIEPSPGHYSTLDTDGPPPLETLELLYRQGLGLVTVVALPDGRYLTYLHRLPESVPTVRPPTDENGCAVP